jgi:hypothetical protein
LREAEHRLLDALRARHGPRAAITRLALSERPLSSVVRVGVAGVPGLTTVFIKVFKVVEGGPSAATLESRVAREQAWSVRLASVLGGHEGLTAVEVVVACPDGLMLATRGVDGVPLTTLTERYALGVGRAVTTALGRVGAWVRVVQALDPPTAPVAPDVLVERLDIRLRRLRERAPRVVSAADRASVLSRFREAVEALPDAERREVPAHNDLAPGNVIVGAAGIAVIDFAMADVALPWVDIARLHHQVGLLAFKPWMRAGRVRAMQDDVRQGVGVDTRSPGFQVATVVHTVNHISRLSRGVGSPAGRLFDRWVRDRELAWLRRWASATVGA